MLVTWYNDGWEADMGQKLERTKVQGIYRRGAGYCVIVGGRKKSAPNMTEAKLVQAKMRSELAQGVLMRSNHTLNTLWAEWEPVIIRRLRKPTVDGYRLAMTNHILPTLGSTRLRDLTAPRVADLRDALSEKLARGTVMTTLAPLKSMLAYACERGYLTANVAKHVAAPAQPHNKDRKVRALTEAELRKFLSVVDPNWRLFFQMLSETGVRISEGIALTWADVGKHGITVRQRFASAEMNAPKSGKARFIPISDKLSAALLEWQFGSPYDGPDDFLFPNLIGRPQDTRHLAKRTLHPAFRRAGIKVEGERLGFHVFRHTAASNWFRDGASVEDASLMLGHASTTITWSIYLHVMPDDLAERARQWLNKGTDENAPLLLIDPQTH